MTLTPTEYVNLYCSRKDKTKSHFEYCMFFHLFPNTIESMSVHNNIDTVTTLPPESFHIKRKTETVSIGESEKLFQNNLQKKTNKRNAIPFIPGISKTVYCIGGQTLNEDLRLRTEMVRIYAKILSEQHNNIVYNETQGFLNHINLATISSKQLQINDKTFTTEDDIFQNNVKTDQKMKAVKDLKYVFVDEFSFFSPHKYCHIIY